ncbi:MAG: hypothetical protein AB7K24_10900 [Gemmataceae bacterium]
MSGKRVFGIACLVLTPPALLAATRVVSKLDFNNPDAISQAVGAYLLPLILPFIGLRMLKDSKQPEE